MNPNKKYLYLSFSRISQLYEKEGSSSSGKVIPRDSLKYYLEHSPEFLGTMRSMRFRLIENAQGYISASSDTQKSRVTTAMIFDYDMLKNNYDIDLEISTGIPETEPANGQSETVEIPNNLFMND